MKLYKECIFVLDRLIKNGFEAYAVGGYVRDSLLLKKPSDIDVATDAPTEMIKLIFADKKQLCYGQKHGTITVFVNKKPIEITTFRSEGGYKDHRHPEYIVFEKDLIKDLERRDFTINAMAAGRNLKIVDPFLGQEDLKNGLIRAVGDPSKRFDEDALRIIRAFRFMAQLDFDIEENTLSAAYELRDYLKIISKERVKNEFAKLILSDHPKKALVSMSTNKILDFDTINDIEKKADILKNSKKDIAFRLFVLLSENDELLKMFTPDKKTYSYIMYLKRANVLKLCSKADIKRALRDYSTNIVKDVLYYKSLCGEDVSLQSKMLNSILRRHECVNLNMLKVSGKDIKEYTKADRENIGKILNTLLDMVIEDKLKNNKKALLNKAKTLF